MSDSRRFWPTVPLMCLAALAGTCAFFLSIKASDFSYWSMGCAVLFGALATLYLGHEMLWDLYHAKRAEFPMYKPTRWPIPVAAFAGLLVWATPIVQKATHHDASPVQSPCSCTGNSIGRQGSVTPQKPLVPESGNPSPNPNPNPRHPQDDTQSHIIPVHGTGELHASRWALAGMLLILMGIAGAPVFAFWAMSRAAWGLRISLATTTSILALTLAGGWSLIKELKLDFTLKLDVEKLVDFAITNEYVTKIISDKVVPRALLVALDQEPIGPFASGEASIVSGEKGVFAEIEKKLADDSTGARPGEVLITGSADRRPLSNLLKMKFGSNMGLARARAEWARDRLEDEYEHEGVPSPTFQILVLPPKYTAITTTARDMQKDRTVSVRAIGIVTAR